MTLNDAIRKELDRLEETKTFKKETLIESEQGAVVRVAGRDVIMLASNNYLGLASHPQIREAAMRGLRDYGHGVASVRFLCGTQTIHRQLEEKIAVFLGTEDTILYSSCFGKRGIFRIDREREAWDRRLSRRDLQRSAESREHHRCHSPVPR
jgi:glycine C-acetyltransferase